MNSLTNESKFCSDFLQRNCLSKVDVSLTQLKMMKNACIFPVLRKGKKNSNGRVPSLYTGNTSVLCRAKLKK